MKINDSHLNDDWLGLTCPFDISISVVFFSFLLNALNVNTVSAAEKNM